MSFTSAEHLRAARRAAGWTQRTLAGKSGLSVDAVKYWEAKAPGTRFIGFAPAAFRKAFADLGLDVDRLGKLRADAPGSEILLKPSPALCGASTRAGGSCQAKALPGSTRCKLHGGMSTGPKSESGRKAISDAQRHRWNQFRAEKGARFDATQAKGPSVDPIAPKSSPWPSAGHPERF